MKNILIACIAIIGFSCITTVPEKQLSREDIIKNNVIVYLQDKLDDPESYEFVSLTLVDSTTFLDNINSRRNGFGEDTTIYKDLSNFMSSAKDKKEYLRLVERTKEILNKIDSIQIALGDTVNNITAYKYILKYRSKNKMAAKTLNEYILQTNGEPNFDIIHMTNDPEDVLVTPNEFPGYLEMITAEYRNRKKEN